VQRNFSLVTFLSILLGAVLAPGAASLPARGEEQSAVPHTVYLPMALYSSPQLPAVFGGELVGPTADELAKASEADVYWARMLTLRWDQIEPNPPQNGVHIYNWSAVDEASLRAIAARGLKLIATVNFAPVWARQRPAQLCSPMRSDALGDFAAFMSAAVSRYGAEPYKIHYWEIWNEPDVDPDLLAGFPDSVFGCWGDDDDPYYGGGYYAAMLQRVYPAIKAADSNAQVLIGGLLMDCDPTNPPGDDDKCRSTRFFDGILANGGGNYFDIVGFHGYPPYLGSLDQDINYPGWKARGGVVLGKISYLRETMSRYHVNKPVYHTEGGLLCPEWAVAYCDPPSQEFYNAQADYVVWLFVRNWAVGVEATTWYTFNGEGWRYGGILGSPIDPKPAYRSLATLTRMLKFASYSGPVTSYPNLVGYEFLHTDRRVWVLWSPDQKEYTVTLPAETLWAYDKFGGLIASSGASPLTIKSPVYVELRR
jgi:hypothetical protein